MAKPSKVQLARLGNLLSKHQINITDLIQQIAETAERPSVRARQYRIVLPVEVRPVDTQGIPQSVKSGSCPVIGC